LPDMFGRCQVLQTMQTQVQQGGIGRQAAPRDGMRASERRICPPCPTESSLATPVEGLSKVVSLPLIGRSRMDSHTDLEGKFVSYSCLDLMQALLGRKGSFQSLGSGREGGAEGISYRLEDNPPLVSIAARRRAS